MRRSVLSVVSVVLIAGAASARVSPFSINLADAGGRGTKSIGNAITGSLGNAFNPAFGSTLPPTAQQIAGTPTLQWDSYWALDTLGPSTPASSTTAADGYSSQGPNLQLFPDATPSTPFGASSWSGTWARAEAGGGFVPSGSDDRVFLGQVTLNPSAVLLTDGVFVNIKDFGVSNPNGQLGAVRFGISNATNNGGAWGFQYYLSVDVLPTTLGGGFSGWVTHAVYLQSIPAPHAGVVLLTWTLLGTHRSRRRIA